MKRLASLAASVMLAVGLLASPSVALAATPIGNCANSGQSYASGEQKNGVQAYGVFASVLVGSNSVFGPCYADDGNLNAASVNIGIAHGTVGSSSWVEIGIINCNNYDFNGNTSGTLCNGSGPHFFAEQHGAFFWDYNMWDLGAASTGVAHTLQILYSGGQYHWAVDGIIYQSFDMGSGLVPTNTDNTEYYQVETKDAADGLGTVGTAANVGQMKRYYSSAWHNVAVGTACDVLSSQHHCVPNGSYAFYAYTTN